MSDRTRGLIGAEELRQMKPTAFLVNMGRGGIVDEAALVEAVDGGVIAGAAIDVFTKEPLPLDHVYMQAKHPERFRFTPHIGWGSEEARTRLVEGIAANIRAWSEGL
jgi:glycerate dehydrogenase